MIFFIVQELFTSQMYRTKAVGLSCTYPTIDSDVKGRFFRVVCFQVQKAVEGAFSIRIAGYVDPIFFILLYFFESISYEFFKIEAVYFKPQRHVAPGDDVYGFCAGCTLNPGNQDIRRPQNYGNVDEGG